jgi:aminopeptidase N
VTVYCYYFAFYNEAGEALLQTTVEAMQVYSERFGHYRHKTLTAVQGDFNDGMEFSGLYFISRDYFNLYKGTPENYLVTIGAHETAHQWWFDGVINDQALEPWLDEAFPPTGAPVLRIGLPNSRGLVVGLPLFRVPAGRLRGHAHL